MVRQFIVLSIFCMIALRAGAELLPEQIRLLKHATALVELANSRQITTNSNDNTARAKSFGSAFCIDSSGIFVTNAHVSDSAQNGAINLILNPGETDQVVVGARVLRSDQTLDLAVLQVNNLKELKNLTVLQVGSSDDLTETDPVTASGFPFGDNLALDKGGYPSVSINTGRITSLRKRKGELELIQLDAALNPGNSGGPVLDKNARVVGIVQAGVRGTGVNFAIPVSRLRQLMAKPELIFAPVAVPFEKRSAEQEFSVKIISFEKPRPQYNVQVTLTAGGDKRTFTANAAKSGDPFIFKAIPVLPPKGTKMLRLTAHYSTGSFTSLVADRSIRIGDQTVHLSELRRVELYDKPEVELASGKILEEVPVGLEEVEAHFGEFVSKVNLAKAKALTIEDPDKLVDAVDYSVVVKEKEKIVAELTGKIEIRGEPVQTVRFSAAAPAVAQSFLEKDLVTRKLPGAVDDVIPAAGGRLLLLQFKALRKLAVFDISERKITQFITLPGDDVLCAAGAEKLVIINPEQNLVQRWDLKSLKKELTTTLPEIGRIESAVAGYSSLGPTLLISRNQLSFVDMNTLKLVDFKIRNDSSLVQWNAHGQYPLSVRASADGMTFAAWQPGVLPTGVRLLTLEDNLMRANYLHDSAAPLVPAQDGSLLFTGAGIYSSDLKAIAPAQLSGIMCAPTYNPSYFLGVRMDNFISRPGESDVPSVSIYSATDHSLLLALPGFRELDRASLVQTPKDTGLTLDKRIHFIPDANLILTISPTQDELILRHFSLTEALERAGINYLFVTSTAPRTIAAGATYSYKPVIKSKRGNIKVSLESGPEGMAIDQSGSVKWTVPAHPPDSVSVVLKIQDALEQEIYHTFNITIR